MYCGTSRTWCGSSSVAIITANHRPRKGNRSRAKAYAATRHETALATTVASAIIALLRKNRPNVTPGSAFQPSG
jgi:hypothetical protein